MDKKTNIDGFKCLTVGIHHTMENEHLESKQYTPSYCKCGLRAIPSMIMNEHNETTYIFECPNHGVILRIEGWDFP